MIKVLLVDDHHLFRTGMKAILDTSDDIEVIAEADTGEAAIDALKDQSPDIVLMDVNMPGIGGLEASRRILHLFPQIRVIAVTAMNSDPFPSRLLDAGVHGYLTKGCLTDELFEAIRTVHRGNHYLPADIAQQLALSSFVEKGKESPLAQLSAREMQVMLMISQGKNNQQMSESLFVSPKTISTFRTRIFEKLEIKNDVELTHMALRYGLIEQES